MAKFTLWTLGNGEPEAVNVKDGEDPRDVFERVVNAMGIDPSTVYSFWQVGDSFRHDSATDRGMTVSIWDRGPGREWIHHARGIPTVTQDEMVILGSCFMNPRASLVCHNEERRLTDRTQEAFGGLVSKGLLSDEPDRGGYPNARRYALTEAGKDYPRYISMEFAEQNKFPLSELIEKEDSDPVMDI